jgi:hypothetical protein
MKNETLYLTIALGVGMLLLARKRKGSEPKPGMQVYPGAAVGPYDFGNAPFEPYSPGAPVGPWSPDITGNFGI